MAGRFSHSHIFHRHVSSRLMRNEPIMPICGFFLYPYCRYLILYSSAFLDSFWSSLHLIAPNEETSKRCWCGFCQLSIIYFLRTLYIKSFDWPHLQAANVINTPSLRKKSKFLTLTLSSIYSDVSQYVSYSITKVSMICFFWYSKALALGRL